MEFMLRSVDKLDAMLTAIEAQVANVKKVISKQDGAIREEVTLIRNVMVENLQRVSAAIP